MFQNRQRLKAINWPVRINATSKQGAKRYFLFLVSLGHEFFFTKIKISCRPFKQGHHADLFRLLDLVLIALLFSRLPFERFFPGLTPMLDLPAVDLHLTDPRRLCA